MRYVRKIVIEGYRGFRQQGTIRLAVPEALPGSGLTVVTGPNNSGKTSVLEAVRALGSRVQPSFGRSQRNSATSVVTIEYEFDDDSTVVLKSSAAGTYATSWSSGSAAPLLQRVYYIPAARDVVPFFNRASATRQDYSAQSAELRIQRNQPINLNARLMTIAEDRALKGRFDAAVSRLLGFDVRWELDRMETEQFVFAISSPTGEHTSDGIGYGVLSVFYLVAGLLDTGDSTIVCIDEPETSMHPQVQRRVAEYLAEKSSDLQVVVSTHSPYFVDPSGFGGDAELVRCYVADGSTKLGRLSEKTKARIAALCKDLHNPHVFGLDAREVFFATGQRRVLIVEGQEDAVILKRLLKRPDISANFEIFGWGAGGAEKVRYVIGVLNDLGITDIAALFDGDKAELMKQLREELPNLRQGVLPTEDIRDKRGRDGSLAKCGVCDTAGNLKPEYETAVVRLLNDLAT